MLEKVMYLVTDPSVCNAEILMKFIIFGVFL